MQSKTAKVPGAPYVYFPPVVWPLASAALALGSGSAALEEKIRVWGVLPRDVGGSRLMTFS